MKKIVFFIDNTSIKNIDCSIITNGNPGIGGTHYIFYLLSYYLSKKKDKIILLTTRKQKLPNSINNVIVENYIKAISFVKDNDIDLLVIRTPNKIDLLKYIEYKKVNTIVWSHNFITTDIIMNEITNNKYILRNICVSKEQLEYYIDDSLYDKSDFIYNLFDANNYKDNIINCNVKKNIVTYIGNISPEKGFHILAKQWKKILQKVPDAELHIIGSGKLYNSNEELGELKLASKKYEKKFIKYIVDDNNKLLSSIHLHGILGHDKNNIIKQSKVGICNIGSKPETFGLTALEFQASGVPVVCYKCEGYLETVNNNSTGYLIINNRIMYKKIIKLLIDNDLNNKFSKNAIEFVKRKFIIDDTCDKWINNFNNVLKDNPIIRDDLKNKWFKGKIIKKTWGSIRKSNKITKKIISYTKLKFKIRRIIKSILNK